MTRRPAPPPRRRPAARLLACTRGVSAIEFAMVAPLLVIAAFMTADAGRAIYERMMIGQALRAGAQFAMTGAEVDDIREVLTDVAGANFTLAAAGDQDAADDALALDVASYCICPTAAMAPVACTATCGGGAAAARLWRLTGAKTFRGVMLPAFAIDGAVEVLSQ